MRIENLEIIWGLTGKNSRKMLMHVGLWPLLVIIPKVRDSQNEWIHYR